MIYFDEQIVSNARVERRFGIDEIRFGFDDVAEFRDDDADLTDCGVASVRRFDVDRDNAVFVCFHTHSITEFAQFRNDCEFTGK